MDKPTQDQLNAAYDRGVQAERRAKMATGIAS